MTVALTFATHLWLQWAWIALDHRDEARAARETDGGPPVNNRELQASMIAIAAAASAIDGFAADIRELGASPRFTLGKKEPPRATVIWETLRANFDVRHKTQTWPVALKELRQLRSDKPGGGLLHPCTVVGEPVALPAHSPAPARLTYTADSATEAVQLMVDIVQTCDTAALTPRPQHGASGQG